MPWFGDRAPRPVFLTLGNHRDFDRLASNKRRMVHPLGGCDAGARDFAAGEGNGGPLQARNHFA